VCYIENFDRVVDESTSPQEVVQKMMAAHGEHGNPFTLWNAATEMFKA
jgi:hypothetical protein